MMVSEFIQFEWLHPTIKESMIDSYSQHWTPKGYVKKGFRDSNMSKGLRPISPNAEWDLKEYIQMMKVKSHNRFLADKLKASFEMMQEGMIDIEMFNKSFISIMERMDFSLEGVWL